MRRLPVRVGDDQRVFIPLCGVDQCFQKKTCLDHQGIDLFFQAEFEKCVIDIVSRAGRMQSPGHIDANPSFQFFLDQEKEVLDLAGIDEARGIDGSVDIFKGASNFCGGFSVKNAGFAQHDQMGLVNASKTIDVMIFCAIEKGAKHCFLVNGVGKLAGIGKARVRIGHDVILSGPPASHRGRCSVAGR